MADLLARPSEAPPSVLPERADPRDSTEEPRDARNLTTLLAACSGDSAVAGPVTALAAAVATASAPSSC